MNYQDSDFTEFCKELTWYIKPEDAIKLGRKDSNPQLSNLFKNTFPLLSNLISKSRILALNINDKDYKLLSWTNNKDQSCGWLIEVENARNVNLKLCLEHELLLAEIGGIRASYNQPEPSLSNNQTFMFIASECSNGIVGWEEYYKELCVEQNCKQMDYENFRCFVAEANGDVTLYNPEDNNKVLLFAHDHCFDNVVFLEGQPEYTFHNMTNVSTFVDYVEHLANEWLVEIK